MKIKGGIKYTFDLALYCKIDSLIRFDDLVLLW